MINWIKFKPNEKKFKINNIGITNIVYSIVLLVYEKANMIKMVMI